MTITFAVEGKPQGKGRPRFTKSGRTYTPKQTTEYEALIRRMYQLSGGIKFEGAVRLSIVMMYSVPKRLPKAEKQMMLCDKIFPTKKPDGDNIEKAVADALNGVAYEDDSQIVEAHWEKHYVDRGREGLIITLSSKEENADEST